MSSCFVSRHAKYVYDCVKPSLARRSMRRGVVNASDRNTTSGCFERCARCTTPRSRTAWCAGCPRGRCARPARSRTRRRWRARPTARASRCLEVERVDVLVLLRRVLRVLDGAVGARGTTPGAPDVRVVGRDLERDVEGDLDAAAARAASTSRRKSSSVPSSGWTALWPPSAAPMAHGLPTSPGSGRLRLFGPLRRTRPMGWMGGR
jgi:hypothetical protein